SVASSVEESQLTQVDKAEVGNRARKGVKWTALQIIARNVLSLGTTAVLARLLSPGDFGCNYSPARS
ncbi:hypothetical protein P3698_25320, partial [Vibrio parahaemolyticus]|nr:hypothetical protein [Vibrio parahaemolyticus]